MNDTLLYDKISALPENIKSEVAAFVEDLLNKSKQTPKKNKPVFGSAKGILIMSDDFDEPLEDFKEYM